MKKIFSINVLIVVILFCFSQQALDVPSNRVITNQSAASDEVLRYSQDDGIIGSWTLVLQAFDDNNNGKLDDEERKKGNIGRHFYQFKADGSCLIHTLKLKGYYELKNVDGKKRLYTYIDDEGTKTPENAWYVISVSKTELILLSQDKYAFWIYKRV